MSTICAEVKMETNKKGRVKRVLKKYGYYALAFVLVLGITLAVVFVSTAQSPEEPTVPSDTTPVVFGLPVESPTVLKWYSDSELFYNETLKQWESHKGIDMTSENLNVYSVLDGVVTDVQTTYEDGTCITITHEGGYVSKYSSLSDETSVTISDTVSAGDVIGTMSESSANELLSGAHLHFELYKDGQKVDPSNYLTLEDK